MIKIYILSGLGADERVFQFLDFSGYEVNFLKWITPHSRESIENYSKRLLNQVRDENPILIGLSFGGMMAIEIAKHVKAQKIIIISSAKSKTEIPFYLRWAGLFHLHKALPASILKKTNLLVNWFFGVENENEKIILKNILQDTDAIFLKWSIDQILSWKNTSAPQNLIHIHGTGDRILPIRFVKSDFKINDGVT